MSHRSRACPSNQSGAKIVVTTPRFGPLLFSARANVGRQLFSAADVGQNKAVALAPPRERPLRPGLGCAPEALRLGQADASRQRPDRDRVRRQRQGPPRDTRASARSETRICWTSATGPTMHKSSSGTRASRMRSARKPA